MKTIWVGNIAAGNKRSLLRSLGYFLLVDVIPVLLLLAVMAYGMVLVSDALDNPRNVEITVVVKELC